MTDLMFVVANEPHGPFEPIRNDLSDVTGATVASALAKAPARRHHGGAATARAMGDAAAACV